MRIASYWLCCGAILVLGGCSVPKEGRDSLEQAFAERYRGAHDSGDVENMMALFWWEGVDEITRFFVKQALVQEIDYPIGSIRFEPLGPEDGFDYEYKGERYQPNLEPYSRIVIEFAIDERLTSSFILGRHEEQLFFVNAAPVETALAK